MTRALPAMPAVPPSAALIAQLAAIAPLGAGEPDATTMQALRGTTRELIAAFKAEGRLAEDPMAQALDRDVALHPAAADFVRGRRVLLTGGAGCVGTRLREWLARMEPAALVSLDRVPHHGPGTGMQADVRDAQALDAAFAQARPEVVFHLAAIREPGRAEAIVREAVQTNVFGTGHVIEACVRHGVRQAVYSSTGKCFSYTTDHVYTGTKKLAEMQWAAAARRGGPTAFAMARFTHVMENGLVTSDIRNGLAAGCIGLHGAQRHFNVQNLRQATHLLLNALAASGQADRAIFWTARDLGWPVNTLEQALYQIDHSGVDCAVRFLGVPGGYDESFFRGQFDCDAADDPHPLVNALEGPPRADASGTMLYGRIQPCADAVLARELQQLAGVLEESGRSGGAQAGGVKQALLEAVDGVARGVFAQQHAPRLLDALWWGAAPDWAGPDAQRLAPFQRIASLLADAVLDGLKPADLAADEQLRQRLADVATSFARLPGLRRRGLRMLVLWRAASTRARPPDRVTATA